MIEKDLDGNLAEGGRDRVLAGMAGLKERAKNTLELAESAAFYARSRPLSMNEKAAKLLSGDGLEHLRNFRAILPGASDWTAEALHGAAGDFAEAQELKLGKVAQPLRAALSGSNISPGIFEVMEILGREESLARIDDALK